MEETMDKDRKKIARVSSPEDRFDSSKPQFRKTTKQSSKVVLDDRFASVLTDSRFQLDLKDKYGRRKKRTTGDDLGEFYKIEKKEDAHDIHLKANEDEAEDGDASSLPSASSAPASAKHEKEEEEVDPAARISYLTALSRGEIDASSDDDSDDDDDDSRQSDDSDDSSTSSTDPVMGKAGVLDPSEEEEIEITMEESPYMAILNMDWWHVRAVDIFTILSSFCPPGAVKRVSVYPSDFGKEKMEKESMMGPVDVWKKKRKQRVAEESDDEEDEDVRMARGEFDGGYDADDPALESGFDPEKLRAYEASKLKYYFAVVQFASSEFADQVYKEVDGMEFEHSSSAMDLRSIPADGVENVIKSRDLRDDATNIPSDYTPPEFVVNALQLSNVRCTWEEGNQDRESMLTKYGTGQAWEELAESSNLNAYIASEQSSDDDSEQENAKASKMRKMLGLDSDDDDDDDDSEEGDSSDNDSERAQSAKEFSFIPGKAHAEQVSILPNDTSHQSSELTPWEKYREKRKAKRREKRQTARAKRKEVNAIRNGGSNRPAQTNDDDFFTDVGKSASEMKPIRFASKQTKGELELLVAGDDEEDQEKDFDMRGLERLEKNKDKKLRGARKRKESKLAANVTGTEFKIDVTDDRFRAVLDGADDRFGIDRTDPNYKETTGMREILSEQKDRRKKKRKTITQKEDKNPIASSGQTGSAALSALVSSLKTKVGQTSK